MIECQVNDAEPVDDATDEEGVEEDVVYSVNSFGADFLIDGLIARLQSEDIYRPTFQRQFVWSIPQASKFIESILLGLPIPGIFLYREEQTRKHLIIDGLQRLTTIASFNAGKFPGGSRIFRLERLKSGFNGKSKDDLDEADKRRFLDRLYTPLSYMNNNALWRNVFGQKHNRGKDLEMILRFLAFRYVRDRYKAPMKIFLNNFLASNRRLQKHSADEMENAFIGALEYITSAVGRRPFRPVKVLNAAAFDAVTVVVSQNIEHLRDTEQELFARRYHELMIDADFRRLITRSTADDQSVRDRFALAESFLLGKR